MKILKSLTDLVGYVCHLIPEFRSTAISKLSKVGYLFVLESVGCSGFNYRIIVVGYSDL